MRAQLGKYSLMRWLVVGDTLDAKEGYSSAGIDISCARYREL